MTHTDGVLLHLAAAIAESHQRRVGICCQFHSNHTVLRGIDIAVILDHSIGIGDDQCFSANAGQAVPHLFATVERTRGNVCVGLIQHHGIVLGSPGETDVHPVAFVSFAAVHNCYQNRLLGIFGDLQRYHTVYCTVLMAVHIDNGILVQYPDGHSGSAGNIIEFSLIGLEHSGNDGEFPVYLKGILYTAGLIDQFYRQVRSILRESKTLCGRGITSRNTAIQRHSIVAFQLIDGIDAAIVGITVNRGRGRADHNHHIGDRLTIRIQYLDSIIQIPEGLQLQIQSGNCICQLIFGPLQFITFRNTDGNNVRTGNQFHRQSTVLTGNLCLIYLHFVLGSVFRFSFFCGISRIGGLRILGIFLYRRHICKIALNIYAHAGHGIARLIYRFNGIDLGRKLIFHLFVTVAFLQHQFEAEGTGGDVIAAVTSDCHTKLNLVALLHLYGNIQISIFICLAIFICITHSVRAQIIQEEAVLAHAATQAAYRQCTFFFCCIYAKRTLFIAGTGIHIKFTQAQLIGVGSASLGEELLKVVGLLFVGSVFDLQFYRSGRSFRINRDGHRTVFGRIVLSFVGQNKILALYGQIHSFYNFK